MLRDTILGERTISPNSAGRQRHKLLALILDSLGSTELLFILVVALIFFGPRKLPQLARSMGKSMAEFRKASEDFKRTWEREVALETARTETDNPVPEQAQLTGTEPTSNHILPEPANPDHVVARQNSYQPVAAAEEVPAATNQLEPMRKHDWL
jgi:Tat protein translocase TatB subunit